jgi:transcriptional regulator with XRE-family HTH domain
VIGENLRAVRLARNLSLATVAAQADISVATLSRIERDKQAIEVNLLVRLAHILQSSAHDLLAETTASETEPIASKISTMRPSDRTRLWRELAEQRLETRGGKKEERGLALADQVEELLAQVDFLRGEIESVRKRLPKSAKR